MSFNRKEYMKEYRKKYKEKNGELLKEKAKKYRIKNIDKIKKWRKDNKEHLNAYSRVKIKEWRIKNPEKDKLARQKYKKDNKERIKKYLNVYIKRRMKIDESFKLSYNIRTRIRRALKKDFKKSKTIDLLGCSIEFLKVYLENKFKEGMSWENYGRYGWHIDHIKPCSKFDLTQESEQKKCFNYTNLQPLWAVDNLKKYNKM